MNVFRIDSEQNSSGSRSRHRVNVPRTQNSRSRRDGSDQIKGLLAQGKDKHQRMDGYVTIEVGKPGHRDRKEIRLGGNGGYDCGNALLAIDAAGGLVWDWLDGQIADHSYLPEGEPFTIMGMELNMWG